MITLNTHYAELKDSYLFYRIAQKVSVYLREHPDTHLYRMGIGDVSLPLCGAVIRALHEPASTAICLNAARRSCAKR